MKLIIDNMKRTGNPVGIKAEKCISWAKDLSIPRGGNSILYTSCMYQMIPYIKVLVEQLEKSEHVGLSSVAVKMGSFFARFIDPYSILKPSEAEVTRSSSIIRKIYETLKRIDSSIGYLYEEEPYSGALLHELGLEDFFIDHARKVVEIFKRYGVKKIYTIDPHTHHILKFVYPMYVDNFDFEIIHYFEVLADNLEIIKNSNIEKEEYVIHDPCLLTRYANIIDQPRAILNKLGVRYREHLRSRNRTRCCGGPIESIAPSISGYMARYRLEELSKISNKIIVMCPICYVSLSRVADKYNASIKDLAEFLG